MRVAFDARWDGPHGIGRFAHELAVRLPNAQKMDARIPLRHPLETVLLSLELWRSRSSVFFSPGYTGPLLSSVPFVFTIHDLIHLHFPAESGLAKWIYYNLLLKQIAQRAYRVLTVSKFSKDEILAWSGLPSEKVVVVGNGVGQEFCPTGAVYDPGFPYFLYVGLHRPHKNLQRLFLAFAQATLHTEVRLVCGGEASASEARAIAELGLGERVIFAGNIPDSEMPEYYRGAVALVLPSLYEGFGLPALEAMACGTPVIASNTTALPEVVGDAGVLVNPLDVNEIACAMLTVLDDGALRAELRRKGLERARLFSWERTAELTWKVLEEAAEQSK